MRISLKLLNFLKKDRLQIFAAIIALGLLFCETASAAPNVIGDIIPLQNSTVTGTVGHTQKFIIPLNESTSVTWTENGTVTTLPTYEGNVAILNHVFQSGSYQVTASVDDAGQIAAWNVEGNEDEQSPEDPDYLQMDILSPKLNFAAVQETPELITVRITNSSGNSVQNSGFKYIKANFSNEDPEIQLFDDGKHRDDAAGDGVFSNEWIPVNSSKGKFPALCMLRVSAEHESLGFAEQSISGTISRKPAYPDLVIKDISWDPANPSENDNITFRIISANNDSKPSQSCTMKFYISGNEVYSYSLPGLEAGSSTSVTFSWIPTASGNMDIKAAVDTENQVSESDEGNNEKSVSFSVKSSTSSSTSEPSTSDSSTSGKSGGKSSSSGSSGGGGGSPELASNVRIKELSQQYITNGKHVKFTFPKNVTCVTYAEFDSKRTAGKTTTIVEMLKNRSVRVSELPSGKVYENMNIWVGNKGTADPENIENAVIGFRVERSWIDSNDVDPAMVLLWRFSSGGWEELSTRQSGEDDRYVYFEAKTPGFSSFAIIALPDANETVGENEESSAVPSVKGADIMGTLLGKLPSKQNSSFLELSALPVNESSSSMEGSSITSKAVERITGRGVMRALTVIVLLSITGYLGSLILRKQN